MQPFLSQLGIGFGAALSVGALVILGPLAGIGLLSYRRRRERQIRKAAVVMDLLRPPGHALREQLEDCRIDLTCDVLLLSALPVGIACLHFMQKAFDNNGRSEGDIALHVFVGCVAFVVIARRIWNRSQQLDRLRLGYDAEMAVGQELDQLMRQGAYVFHDVDAEGFNIDHVVVATAGVFAVETKGYTKPNRGLGKADATVAFDGKSLKFPTWTTSEPIEQAERQATWLARWLSQAVAQPVPVLAVLALPGWFVERTGRGGVRVFSGRELAGLLRARGAQPLPAQDVERIAHQLDQRCRNVVPAFRQAEKSS